MRCFWPEGPDYRWFLDPAEDGVIDPQTGLTVFSRSLLRRRRARFTDAARFTFTLVSGDRGIESNLTLDAATLRRLAE